MRRAPTTAVLLALGILAAAFTAATAAAEPGFKPIDPQRATFQDDMTWAEFTPVPGAPDWEAMAPSVQEFKGALVLGDFPNQPFVVTQAPHSTIFGNPQLTANNIPRAAVAQFYEDFLNTPQPLNNEQTLNRYWMEDSLGRFGVDLEAFGPYAMDFASFQYFQEFQSGQGCPSGFLCNKNFRSELNAKWRADVGDAVANGFDFVFYVSSGQDESSTWQEFGEMMFQTMDDVTAEFGPGAYGPIPTGGNWTRTRYIPWTSWAAGATMWPSAGGGSSQQAESSGMSVYAHEFSHILGIGDNYNNPFGIPLRRSYSGPWDMLSRGTFNGPGGPHRRWLIPATEGAALGSNHNLRNRMELGIVDEGHVLRLDRNELDDSGLVVARVTVRAADPGAGGLAGFNIALNPSPDLADPARGDQSPPCVVAENPDCPGPTRTSSGNISSSSLYHNYTVEVVDRIGNDSFTPGHGVLIQRTKNQDSAPFVWTIDAHPEDMNTIDFLRPDGTPAMVTYGDWRQLNDATFHAGLDSGSRYEYVDEPNRLHFYVIDAFRQGGLLSYQLGVRSLDGAGPQERGVDLADGTTGRRHAGWTDCEFVLRNTGSAGPIAGNHPENVDGYLRSDVYRLSASVEGAGWSAKLYNALATAKAGRRDSVRVYVERSAGTAGSGVVTLTATSESDPTKADTATCTVTQADVK